MREPLTFGSVFAGIGGFDLALSRAGWRCLWGIENDAFCRHVLERRFPGVPVHGDVRAVAVDALAPVDLLCGGFPCQDLSVAGKRAGLKGARSGLFFEFMRVASGLRPHWLLIENVPGWFSSHQGRDFAAALVELGERGYDASWVTLDSRHFGVPQRRRRVFLVGHLRDSCRCAPEVLLEPEGGAGHPAAGEKAGTRIAHALAAGAGGSKFGSGRGGQDDFVIGGLPTLQSHEAKGAHFEHGLVADVSPITFDRQQDSGNSDEVTPTLNTTRTPAVTFGDHGPHPLEADRPGGGPGGGAEGPGAQVQAVGQGIAGDAGFRAATGEADPDGQLLLLAPLPAPLPPAQGQGGVVGPEDAGDPAARPAGGACPAGTGVAGADVAGARAAGGVPETAGALTAEAASSRRHGHQGFLNNQAVDAAMVIAQTLRDSKRAGDRGDGVSGGVPMVTIPIQYAEQWGCDKRQNGVGLGDDGDPSFTLDASYPHGIGTGAVVRRLTPLECERLQAFPDGWTCLCGATEAMLAERGVSEADWRRSDWRTLRLEGHTARCRCPDSARYRALGNAVTVSVVQWIGGRLAETQRA